MLRCRSRALRFFAASLDVRKTLVFTQVYGIRAERQMQDIISDNIAYLQRHELDALDALTGIDASPARPDELPTMIALARAHVPGVTLEAATLERVYYQHPECIFPFRCGGRIAGA
ncbi:MAG TPA: hypothetical protein VGJ01_06355 [Pseudolabrys sp.]